MRHYRLRSAMEYGFGLLQFLTASEQEANIATAVDTRNPFIREKERIMTLKIPLQEAKERALELMKRGYH